jgi:hypothetical protein
MYFIARLDERPSPWEAYALGALRQSFILNRRQRGQQAVLIPRSL